MRPTLRNGIIGAVIIGVLSLVAYFALQPSDETQLRLARRALAGRSFDQAEALALAVARRRGTNPQAWIVAVESAAGAGNWDASLQYYEQVHAGTAQQRSVAACGRGEACVQLKHYARAEKEFRQALVIDPQLDLARRRLADLLIFTGRRHTAMPLLEQLASTPLGTVDDLFHLADPDHLVSRSASVFAGARETNADLLLIMGAAFQALVDGQPAEAVELFERVLSTTPTDTDALAGYGQALLQAAPQRLPAWRARLTATHVKSGAVLAVLDQIAEQEGQLETVSRLAARVVAQRPTSRVAWHRLGTSLGRQGRAADAGLALQRARHLQELGTWMDDLFTHRRNLRLIRRVAERLANIGRATEAVAWARLALGVSPGEAWASKLIARLESDPQAAVDVSTEAALSSLLTELTAASVTEFLNASQSSADVAAVSAKSEFDRNRIRFVDAASTTGLDFVFHSGRDATTPGARIIETTGGGVGVLDYDLDDWPDVYFTQGSRTFPLPETNPDRDRLFRNDRGQAWADVAIMAGIDDARFGQGVAVGDFNNDGFPDLYVANYGVNRLYQNQGDGTFQDVTPGALRERPVWTSSCVIADLNRDGLPDLFDATYCRGTDVETRLCEKQGVARSCSPRVFGAEADRVWLNRGDETWDLAAHDTLDLPGGLGLGVVVFRTTPDSPLGVFVANDEEPNCWLVNVATQSGDQPRWEDRALTGGLAVDADGQTQACMGVACDDANGDGWPDLFVTNFYHESNTLYLSMFENLFADQTRSAKLRDASWSMLGFGTQFIDADLDGWPDLLVANGHIDDLSASGEPFEMPPQCFQNRGGVFRELTAAEAGQCFGQRAIGRGMARLDWNRDGREDAVIVNQDSPASLLTNVSESSGRALVLQFRATAGARDAIGTIVRVHCGSKVLTRQLTAGDGYQASNERQLVIGLGTAEVADKVEVFWPDRAQQEIKSLPTNHQYIVIQGPQSANVWRVR